MKENVRLTRKRLHFELNGKIILQQIGKLIINQ